MVVAFALLRDSVSALDGAHPRLDRRLFGLQLGGRRRLPLHGWDLVRVPTSAPSAATRRKKNKDIFGSGRSHGGQTIGSGVILKCLWPLYGQALGP